MAKAAKPKKALVNETPSVDAWMATLDHPLKAEMQAVRAWVKYEDDNS